MRPLLLSLAPHLLSSPLILSGVLLVLAPSVADAQASAPTVTATKVATRQLSAVTATSTDSMGAQVAIRARSTGEVLVNDVQRDRVLLFDKTLNWKRLTDEQNLFMIDSVRPALEKQLKAQSASLPTIPTPNGLRKMSITFDFPPLKDLADYEPSVSPGSVKADLDNRLWIVPRTAVVGGGGLRCDVVDRDGELVDRVQFPKGRALAGFGPGGVVYMLNTDGKTSVLERATVK